MIPVAYLLSEHARKRHYAHGRNYWDVYLGEIASQLGVPAQEQTLDEFVGATGSNSCPLVLLVGELDGRELTQEHVGVLAEWVERGGILIGCATSGLDGLFGNVQVGCIEQQSDYDRTGYARLRRPSSSPGPDHEKARLPIFSGIRLVNCTQSEPLADLFDARGVRLPHAAVTARAVRGGAAFYFAFSLPQTVWLLHQGRPVAPEGIDVGGVRYCKATGMSLLRDSGAKLPYADELLLLVQWMIAHRPVPFIHQLPPHQGRIPDGLMYWGGDDEFIAGCQMWASDWMKRQGLPYHINTLWQDGKFSLTPQEKSHIEANGHEVSLHYNFIDGNVAPYTFGEHDVRRQYDDYRACFGAAPVTSVIHYTLWQGWSEPAQWMCECGALGDNSFICEFLDYEPAFSAGTALPFFFRTDWRSENRRLAFIEQPITGFEIGYCRTASGPEDDTIGHTALQRAVDLAVSYHGCINMFYHAYRIRDWAACRRSILETLSYIKEKGCHIMHVGNDALTRWWHARDRARIGDYLWREPQVRFTVRSDWPDGVIVRLPTGRGSTLTVDGERCPPQSAVEGGIEWTCIVIPCGEHTVVVRTKQGAGRP